MARSLMALGAVMLLAGCVAEPFSGPPEYRAGYEAGCRSGHADARGAGRAIHYDAKAFEAERIYREARSRGYLECLIRGRRVGQPLLFDVPFLPTH